MNLKNPFPNAVRWLFFDTRYRCLGCGSNSGITLHHILGRVSGVAFNACPLCDACHSVIGHTQQEHQRYFLKTLQFLFAQRYNPTQADLEFLKQNEKELVSDELNLWLSQTYKRQ